MFPFFRHRLSLSYVVINFSHVYILQNYWADFNEIYHRASLGFQFGKIKGQIPLKVYVVHVDN